MQEGCSHNSSKQTQVKCHVCRTARTAPDSRRWRWGLSPVIPDNEGCSLVLQWHCGYLWGQAPLPFPFFQSIPPHTSKPSLPGIGVSVLPVASPPTLWLYVTSPKQRFVKGVGQKHKGAMISIWWHNDHRVRAGQVWQQHWSQKHSNTA